MLTFVKLGGSLITDKRIERSFNRAYTDRLANEIREAIHENPNLKLLVGHGSGAFGHFAAQRYRTMDGVYSATEWRGFAQVATVAAELNYRVAASLTSAGLPIWRIQPSASVLCRGGTIEQMALHPIQHAIAHNIIPLIYGDVALDTVRGGTIVSTEKLFAYLAFQLPVKRILLLGEVDGVYDAHGNVIPEITWANFDRVAPDIGSASGIDVTGGMMTKVHQMLELARFLPEATIHILNGARPGLLQQALTANFIQSGTIIRHT